MDSKQITEAMRLKLPVRYNGNDYLRITEYILWYDSAGHRQTSLTLLDRTEHSTVRALAHRVELAGKEADDG